MPNPLAIGVTLGGLLLDVVAPRPKPRAGYPSEPSLLAATSLPRTPRPTALLTEADRRPVASGRRN